MLALRQCVDVFFNNEHNRANLIVVEKVDYGQLVAYKVLTFANFKAQGGQKLLNEDLRVGFIKEGDLLLLLLGMHRNICGALV